MNETYVVEFLHLGNRSTPTVVDSAASAHHDFEIAREHAFETFRRAQTSGWGGPIVDAFRILDEKHEVLFNWTLPEEKALQEAELQRRHEMTKALNVSLGLEKA